MTCIRLVTRLNPKSLKSAHTTVLKITNVRQVDMQVNYDLSNLFTNPYK